MNPWLKASDVEPYAGMLGESKGGTAGSQMSPTTEAEVRVETGGGIVTIPNGTLASIVKQAAGDDVKISIEQKTVADITDKTIDTKDAVIATITVASSDKTITTFGGESQTVGILVGSAYTAGQCYKVIILSADGTKETATGKCVSQNGTLIVEVVTKEKAAASLPFTDVKVNAWYYEAVQYAVEKGLFSGYSEKSLSSAISKRPSALTTT